MAACTYFQYGDIETPDDQMKSDASELELLLRGVGGLTVQEKVILQQNLGVANVTNLTFLSNSSDMDRVFGEKTNDDRLLVRRRLEDVIQEIRCGGWNLELYQLSPAHFLTSRRLLRNQNIKSRLVTISSLPTIFHVVAGIAVTVTILVLIMSVA